MPIGELEKWKMLLSEFDTGYMNQKAIEGKALVDHLAENLGDEAYEPYTTYLPDKDFFCWGRHMRIIS